MKKYFFLLFIPLITFISCSEDDNSSSFASSTMIDKIIFNSGGVRNFYYDEKGLLIKIGESSNDSNIDELTYLENGNLATHSTRGIYLIQTITLSYENNIINDVNIELSDYYVFERVIYKMLIENQEAYSLNRKKFDIKTDILLEEITYTIDLIFDADNRVLSYKRINDLTGEEKRIEFEYYNNNLSRIDEYNSGVHIIYEMTYDDKLNYLQDIILYKSAHCYYSEFYYLPGSVRNEMLFIPAFLNFKNQNNIASLKVDGSLVQSFEYSYNNLDLPSSYEHSSGRGWNFFYR